MSTILYHRHDDGTVHLVNTDQHTGENRIPNYVWDLWLPLLGAEAIGVYSFYCRLKRNGKVKGVSLKKIAKACQIGTKKLNQINTDLETCGFISTSKPDGHARLMHWTTEIDIHPVPTVVQSGHIEKFKPKGDYEIVAEWLVKDVDDDDESDTISQVLPKSQVTPPKEPTSIPEGTNQILASASTGSSKIESFNLNQVEVESLSVEDVEVEVMDVEKDDDDRDLFAKRFYHLCNHDPNLTIHKRKCESHINELWEAGYRLADLGSVDLYITYEWTKPDIYPSQIVEIIRVAVMRYGNGIPVEFSDSSIEGQPDDTGLFDTTMEDSEQIADIYPARPASRHYEPPAHPSANQPTGSIGKMTFKDAWLATKGQLELQLNRATYDTWVADTKFYSFEDGVLTLYTRNNYAQDWIVKRLSRSIMHIYSGISNSNLTGLTTISHGYPPITTEHRESRAVEGNSRGKPESQHAKLQSTSSVEISIA